MNASTAAIAPLSSTSSRATDRMIGRVPRLVDDVVACLDTPGDPLTSALAACNAALEHCLERSRDEARDATARDDLQRLLRLLAVVERDDAPCVLRQIRRVLGRLDV